MIDKTILVVRPLPPTRPSDSGHQVLSTVSDVDVGFRKMNLVLTFIRRGVQYIHLPLCGIQVSGEFSRWTEAMHTMQCNFVNFARLLRNPRRPRYVMVIANALHAAAAKKQ